ncbi:hypothetical protein [Lactiplantibacillus paraxiangfangensis]|uniref:hypothetical protein n=1 Tax=Lactiplantibacillus paraxiangfangensis TaxID=3076224 RepID=UPI0030C73614
MMSPRTTMHELISKAVDRHSITNREMAKKVHVDPGQMSRMRSGKRPIHKEMRIIITGVLKDCRLAFQSASFDYKVPSFRVDKSLKTDVYHTSWEQRKLEVKRQKMEPAFNDAVAVDPKYRTAEQIQVIHDYLFEYVSEASAEQADYITKAEYAGYSNNDLLSLFNEFNQKFGVVKA